MTPLKFIYAARFCSLLLCINFCLRVEQGFADGYGLSGHSVEGVSVANAGGVAGYSDGSSAYYNPAAMGSIRKPTMSIGAHWVPLDFDLDDKGSTVVGLPNTGSDANEHVVDGLIPNIYGVFPIDERFTAGFFVDAPFGLATRYPRDWVGRYQATNTELTVVNMGVSLAAALDHGFSLGVSLGANYADGRLENALDFGTIGFSALGAPTAGALGLAPQQNDGYFKLTGQDWALAWGVGASYAYGEKDRNRLGLVYRASNEIDLHGDSARFEVPASAQVLTSSGAFTDTPASTKLTLPESITFGASHWLDDQWNVMYQSQWTRWTRTDEIVVLFENPAQPTATEQYGWDNSWKHSVGASYYPCGSEGDWRVGAGFMYDQSPIRSPGGRSPRVPDGENYWLTTGLSYRFSETLRTDLAYAHVIFADGKVERSGATGDVLAAEWHNSFDVISLALVWNL